MDLYIRGKQKEWGGDRLSWLPGSSCLLITIWFYVDHLGKHKECGKSVCVCVCFTILEFSLGNQNWEENVVGNLKDTTRPREEEEQSIFQLSPSEELGFGEWT